MHGGASTGPRTAAGLARINPALTDDGNLALPPPPAGLWAVWQSDYPPHPPAPVGLPPARQPVDLAALTLPAG